MKLWNLTRLPTPVVHALLVKAGRAVGARTSKVVVVVKQSNRTHGCASACSAVRAGARVFGKARQKGSRSALRWIKTDGGYIELFVQRYPDYHIGCGHASDTGSLAGSLARKVFELAMHEWGHVVDFQANDAGAGRRFSSANWRNGRRPTWGDRPEELRAQHYVEAAMGQVVNCAGEIEDYAGALAADWHDAPAKATAVHVGQSSHLGRLGSNTVTGEHRRHVFGKWAASLVVEGTHVRHARVHADGGTEFDAYKRAVDRATAMGVRCDRVEMHIGHRITPEERTRFLEHMQSRNELEAARGERER